MAACGTLGGADNAQAITAVYDAVVQAITVGYRHIDTAEGYASAPHTARAICDCLGAVHGGREGLWITSKLRGLPCGPYEAVEARVHAMLQDRGLQYFDLLLCHWPGQADVDPGVGSEGVVADSCGAEWYRAHIGSAWENMQRLCRDSGLVRHVGVSNFYEGHLVALRDAFPGQAPYANQLFIDATHHEDRCLAIMQDWGVRAIAYRPIAFAPIWELAGSMGDGMYLALCERAAEVGADSVQQLVLAWLCGRGVGHICYTSNRKHAISNLTAKLCRAACGGSLLAAIGPDVAPAALAQADGNETVAACGGHDEFALAFKQMVEAPSM